MDFQDLLTAQDRIKWAIQRAKDRGLSPESLARKVDITRPGLLHWTDEACDVSAIGVGRLRRFAQAAEVNIDWLLDGKGLPTRPYAPSEQVAELASALEVIAREEPAEYRVISRIIQQSLKRGS